MHAIIEQLKAGWLFFVIGFGFAFFFLFLGIVPTSFNVGPFELGRSTSSAFVEGLDVPIAVDSKKDWQAAGVTLTKGDNVFIEVSGGKWTPAMVPLPGNIRSKISDDIGDLQVTLFYIYETSGEGSSHCATLGINQCPLPENPIGQLVGKIGRGGQPFAIGSNAKFIANDSGILYLRINDGPYLDDNVGVLAVNIYVE